MSDLGVSPDLIMNLLKKRPASPVEKGIAEAVNKPVQAVRYHGLRVALELMVGQPLSTIHQRRLYAVAVLTTQTNVCGLWDDDLQFRYWAHFYRREWS